MDKRHEKPPKQGLVGFFTSAAGLITAVVGLVSALLGLLAYAHNANPQTNNQSLTNWAKQADRICARAHPSAVQALAVYVQGAQTGNFVLSAQGGSSWARRRSRRSMALRTCPLRN